jgi:RND family efflux transporter MFP subunit
MKLLHTIKKWIVEHKKLSVGIVGVGALVGYGVVHAIGGTTGTSQYVLAQVSKTAIASSISGSGQVAASNQIDILPKASGVITSTLVKSGQSVKKGDLIATVDARSALIALENAKISLAKLQQTDSKTTLQDQNLLQELNQTVGETYDQGRKNVAKTLLDIPTVISGIDALYANNGYLSYQNTFQLSKNGKAIVDTAEQSKDTAESAFHEFTKEYVTLSQLSDNKNSDVLFSKTLAILKLFTQAVVDTQNAVDRVAGILDEKNANEAVVTRTNLTTWASIVTTNTNTIQSSQSTLVKTNHTIDEQKQALSDIQNGLQSLDVQSAQLNVVQKQNDYNDYFIRAPFDGIIADFTAQVGQSTSGSIGTLITKQKIATLTLNEVDVAKVSIGQKATLLFDAVEGLSIAGEVVEINPIGTVTQGVVTYSVKIAFDSQDDRIKSGMSATATIVTESKADVLVVPSSAIKSSSKGSYVLVLDTPGTPVVGSKAVTSVTEPKQVPVVIGISSDTGTEILSGLTEGEHVVSKVINTTTAAKTTTTQTPSILGGSNRGIGR